MVKRRRQPAAPDARWHGREAFFNGFHLSIASFASAGLVAPREEVERRERARGNGTVGEAREHFGTHDHCPYDFTISTTQPAGTVAAQVTRAWHARTPQPK